MAAEVTENYAHPGDTRNGVLETLAEHDPWVFVVCHIDVSGAIDLKVDCGGGIPDSATIRSLLQKTLDALPE